MSKDIVELLNEAGYVTIEGKDAVLNAIKSVSDGSNKRLCSGYRVFPDGSKCLGCEDCEGVSP